MKLNWAERWVVNNPLRVIQQRLEIGWMKNNVSLQSGSIALEIGCGRGEGARLISKNFQPDLLHAMDVDIEMINKAKKRLSPCPVSNVSLYVGDALHLPYRDNILDAVFGFGVLHHIVDWDASLTEITRVLKKGGYYFFEELYPSLYQNFITKHILLHPRQNRFYSKHLCQGFKEAGLLIKDSLEIKKLGILGVAVKGD
jgi:ubiquinone/menaquinone biosynthesis C-methylase UbiE